MLSVESLFYGLTKRFHLSFFRIAKVTQLPIEMIRSSEALQVSS